MPIWLLGPLIDHQYSIKLYSKRMSQYVISIFLKVTHSTTSAFIRDQNIKLTYQFTKVMPYTWSYNSRAFVVQINNKVEEIKHGWLQYPQQSLCLVTRTNTSPAPALTDSWESPGSCPGHTAASLDLGWHRKSMTGYLDVEAVWRLVLTSTKGPLSGPEKVSACW